MTDWDWPDSKIVHIIDGDTLIAVLTRDLGFNGKAVFEQKLRLNRINCPPASTVEGKAATQFVEDTVNNAPVHITTVGPYKYRDEWMAEVVLANGKNLSDALAQASLAYYWNGRGPRPGG